MHYTVLSTKSRPRTERYLSIPRKPRRLGGHDTPADAVSQSAEQVPTWH